MPEKDERHGGGRSAADGTGHAGYEEGVPLRVDGACGVRRGARWTWALRRRTVPVVPSTWGPAAQSACP